MISRLICAPGHWKSIVDGLNASSKTKSTLKSAKQLKAADEACDDSLRKFTAHSMWLMELVFQLLLSSKECSSLGTT